MKEISGLRFVCFYCLNLRKNGKGPPQSKGNVSSLYLTQSLTTSLSKTIVGAMEENAEIFCNLRYVCLDLMPRIAHISSPALLLSCGVSIEMP
jgi:hypothetical protein